MKRSLLVLILLALSAGYGRRLWLGHQGSGIRVDDGRHIPREATAPRGEPQPNASRNDECEPPASDLPRFESRPLIFRVVFGYKDTRPSRFVGDRYERNYLVEELKKLGFVRDEQNEDDFTSTRQIGEQTRKVLLRLVHSSVGPDDQDNRHNPWQRWQSQYAQGTFLEGLRQADAVFYLGHSRTGGGPDFNPPVIDAQGNVAYAKYAKDRPGVRTMLAALTTRISKTDKLKWLGLYSCSSSQHFKKALLEKAPGLFIESTESVLYYSDSLREFLKALSRLMRVPCSRL